LETWQEGVSWRPPPSLRPYVDECHGYRYSGAAPGIHRGLPSSLATVVIAFEQPVDVGWFAEPQSRDRFWGLASGLHTGPADIVHDGRQFGIQLGLTECGVRNLLGMPLSALAHQLVAMDDLLPPALDGWYDEINAQPTWQRRFAVLESVLLRLAARNAASDVSRTRPELLWAWQRIAATGGSLPVGALADELAWSRRHLHTLFSREFGVSPKQASRIVRFQRSKAMFTAKAPLGEVAAACGYADQAHLTREWRALSGYSPWQWARAELPFVQDLGEVDLTESGYA
jgi:AraC-like DNA-binding protein